MSAAYCPMLPIDALIFLSHSYHLHHGCWSRSCFLPFRLLANYYRHTPVKFEADDTNHRIDFVTVSNIRAMNYNIAVANRHTAKTSIFLPLLLPVTITPIASPCSSFPCLLLPPFC